MTPHDLRRFAATYASRNGVPLETISKVILRYRDLRTTQVYLGKVSDSEDYPWMDSLHGSRWKGVVGVGPRNYLSSNYP